LPPSVIFLCSDCLCVLNFLFIFHYFISLCHVSFISPFFPLRYRKWHLNILNSAVIIQCTLHSALHITVSTLTSSAHISSFIASYRSSRF
jgi:hypothetical protein